MNRHLFAVVFLLGAVVVVWVGTGFIHTSYLALVMTIIIGAVYGLGAVELQQYRGATAVLVTALTTIPAELTDLGDWLAKVPVALQNSVRSRIEGERGGLPGPSLTPYLVGLLVMMGMLGTFLGMVVTLNGAVFALEKTTDLEAIRAALAVPIKGLGLAFGTSVAGVATSAMLGLMSALSRRERIEAAQLLDTKIATVLRPFSLVHQRQESFKALQMQSRALPEVADKLQALVVQLVRMTEQSSERLHDNQENFHRDVKGVYTGLAHAVDKSLRDSLTQAAHAAGENIKPVVETAMRGIAQEATLMYERMAVTVQMQLDALAARFDGTATTVSHTWTAALRSHELANGDLVAGIDRALGDFNDTFVRRSDGLVASVGAAYTSLQAAQTESDDRRYQAWTQSLSATAATLASELQKTGTHTLLQQREICATLTRSAQNITEQARTSASSTLAETTRLVDAGELLMRSRITSEAQWIAQHNARMDQVASLLRTELGALRTDEALRGDAAVARLGQLQAALTSQLTTLGRALEAPITRLIETASEAPRAAAEVLGKLRHEISSSVARDNELLEERTRIMATLNTLLDAINHAAVEQRSVIDSLVASSTVTLNAAGSTFADNVRADTARLADIAAHVTTSAVEVSSLSEAFGFAVTLFSDANEKLIVSLQRIEDAMDKSMLRSDEQLAYYVAQAREVIDLSMGSQKEIFEALRQLPAKQAADAEGGR